MLMKHGKTTAPIKGVVWICALIVGLSFTYVTSKAYSASTEEVLKITPEQHDFGTIPEGDPAVTTAIIENIGDSPVEITNVRTS